LTRARGLPRLIAAGGVIATVLLTGCTIPPGDCRISIAGTDEPLARDDAMPAADVEVVVAPEDFDLAGTTVVEDAMGEPALVLVLHPAGAQRFEAYTRDHVGEFLLIALDDVVVSAPLINEAIPGGIVQISAGGDDPDWIRRFDGCLPVEVLGGG
jgi:hypothetical protein